MNVRPMWMGVVAIAALMLGGCGEAGDDTTRTGAATQTPSGLPIPTAMQNFQDDGNVLELTIEGDDMMRYDVEAFSVQPGQMVRLTLEHVGNLPASAMGHNVVIIQQGEDFMDFAADANEQGAAQDNDFVPEPVRERVIAMTELIGGGQSSVVEFQAPEELGGYPFLCTFPGHAAQMNGTMTVAP